MPETVVRMPYAQRLGVEISEIGAGRVRLKLPFKEENSNPGQALHGGVAASMINLGGLAVARQALGNGAGPFHTAATQVSYLSAAIGEPITADARLLRRGKEICFVAVSIATEDGKAIAEGLSTVRARFGAEEPPPVVSLGDDGAAQPGPMGEVVPKTVRFIGRLGLAIENMSQGKSRIAMPFIDINADGSGGVHEGAVLALLDTTGAMAAWAETGPGAFKASTVGIQAQIVAPTHGDDLVAYGRVAQRDADIFWSAVEVASRRDLKTVARGTVLYRIVT